MSLDTLGFSSIRIIQFSLVGVALLGALSGLTRLLRPYKRPIWGASLLSLLSAALLPGEVLFQESNHIAPWVLRLPHQAIGLAWWLVAGWSLAQGLSLILQLTIFPRSDRPRARKLFADLLSGLIYVGALLGIVTDVFHQPFSGLLATSGVAAVLLGLGLQNTLGDMFSGIALNIELPFRAGDWISVGAEPEGQVIEINWRATRVRTRAGDIMVIPNSVMTKTRVINHYLPSRLHSSTIRLALDTTVDPARAVNVICNAMSRAPRIVVAPSPEVLVSEFGESAISYEILYWISDYLDAPAVQSAALTAVWQALSADGLGLAVPRCSLDLRTGSASPYGKHGETQPSSNSGGD